MATALVALDGVIRDTKGQPIPEGVALFHALTQGYRVAISMPEYDEKASVDHWLTMEGLTEYQELMGETPGSLRGGDYTLGQVDALLGRGQHVGLVVVSDPSAAALVLHRGVTCVVFSHPKFSRPEYRPDWEATPRPWDVMVAEIETQTRLENLRPKGEK